jgi:hypothetical protein
MKFDSSERDNLPTEKLASCFLIRGTIKIIMAYHKYERLTFQNKYGTLIVEPFGEVVDVCKIHSKDTSPELWFEMETAEKIALITENWHVQLCGPFPIIIPAMMYLIAHTACDKAFRVKIVTLEYIGPDNPRAEIAQWSPRNPF